jgi:hypothetical protein
MPELPEIEALAAFLRDRAVGRIVIRSDVAAFSAVKTFDPPLNAINGLTVTGADRHGKFLDLEIDGLHLITHLSRGGWLQWREKLSPVPPKPGRGPLAFRLHLAPNPNAADAGAEAAGTDTTAGFDLTEAGTQKRLAVYLVRDPMDVPGIARLGPDAMRVSLDEFAAVLAGQRGQLKGALTTVGTGRGRQRLLGRDPARGQAVAVRHRGQAEPRPGEHPVRRDASDTVRRRPAIRRPAGSDLEIGEAQRPVGACPYRTALPGLR